MKHKWEKQNSCDGKYDNSLDVRFTKACDNHCDFCIEQNGVCARERNVNKMIYNTIVSGKETVLILGGEPFLHINDLKTYVEGIRPYVKYIYITTSLPNTINQHYDVFSTIMKQIDGLNVSFQHYNWEKNNEILHASSNHNRFQLLRKICSNNDFAAKCRASINLVKGSVDTKMKLYRFLNKMVASNVKHVKINELQFTPDLYISFEDMMGKDIKYLHLKSPYSHGCQSEITLKRYPNLKITLKRACPYVEPSLKFSKKDKKKQRYVLFSNQHSRPHFTIVLYEDGELSIGWKQKEREESL